MRVDRQGGGQVAGCAGQPFESAIAHFDCHTFAASGESERLRAPCVHTIRSPIPSLPLPGFEICITCAAADHQLAGDLLWLLIALGLLRISHCS